MNQPQHRMKKNTADLATQLKPSFHATSKTIVRSWSWKSESCVTSTTSNLPWSNSIENEILVRTCQSIKVTNQNQNDKSRMKASQTMHSKQATCSPSKSSASKFNWNHTTWTMRKKMRCMKCNQMTVQIKFQKLKIGIKLKTNNNVLNLWMLTPSSQMSKATTLKKTQDQTNRCTNVTFTTHAMQTIPSNKYNQKQHDWHIAPNILINEIHNQNTSNHVKTLEQLVKD